MKTSAGARRCRCFENECADSRYVGLLQLVFLGDLLQAERLGELAANREGFIHPFHFITPGLATMLRGGACLTTNVMTRSSRNAHTSLASADCRLPIGLEGERAEMDDVLVEDEGGAGDAWRGEPPVLAKAQRRRDMLRSLRGDGQELSGQRTHE
jgi:hypothetical protein